MLLRQYSYPRAKTKQTIILPMADNTVLKLNSIRPRKGVKTDTHRLEEMVELSRAEMLKQLHHTGYDFSDARVIKTSRKLDRLLNLYYRCNTKPD